MRRREIERLVEKQLELAGRVRPESPFRSLRDISSVAGFSVRIEGGYAAAAGVVLRFPELSVLETATVRERSNDSPPYLPAFLAFREAPVLLKVARSFKSAIDVFICHGHGIAHPRRMGLASHLGVMLDRPTIGCARRLLYGESPEPPPGVRGAYQYIRDENGDILGIALRTKKNVRTVFVSPGHLMDVEMAGDIALACSNHRMPEPLRLAHALNAGNR